MALSAAGVGSGLDVSGILQKLMAIERQPLTRIAEQQSGVQARLSAFGQLKSAMSKLQDAATALTKAEAFSSTTVNAGDSKAFTATSTAAAQPGSYNIEITALARAQRVASSATEAPTVGAGTLSISLGSYGADGSFSASGSETTISLEAGASLSDLRDAINKADAGVTAQIINNGTVNQLVISSKETGAAHAFRLSGSGELAGFSYGAGGGAMSTVQSAQDAALKIDGLAVTRSSNTVSDVLEGVTLNLSRLSEGETAVTIARDNDASKKAIEDFTKAYNELNSLMRTQTSYNAETKKGGLLNGDSTVRSIQNQLRNVFANPLSGLEGARMLSDVGIKIGTDGNMSIDSKKLEAALADPAKKVGELFGGNGTVDGFGKILADRLKGMLDTDGILSSRTEGLNRMIKSLDGRKEALEFRLERIEARYAKQFSALDGAMASMTSTSAFLSQQLMGMYR